MIDSNGRPVQVADSTGAFAAWPDAIARAYILIAYGVKRGDRIGEDYVNVIESKIRRALEPLTKPKDPVVEIEKITISVDGSRTYWEVRLKDLKDGSKTHVLTPRVQA